MQSPIGKPFKTHGLAHCRVAISSRIREVRENLAWILEGTALQLEGLQAIPMKVMRWLWTGAGNRRIPLGAGRGGTLCRHVMWVSRRW